MRTWHPYKTRKDDTWGKPAKRRRDDVDKLDGHDLTAQDRLTWRRHAQGFAQPRNTMAVNPVHWYVGFLTNEKPVRVPYLSNEKYMTSSSHAFTTSSRTACRATTMPCRNISLIQWISCQFGEFISIVTPPKIWEKPPCLILMWVPMLSSHGVRSRWFTGKRTC